MFSRGQIEKGYIGNKWINRKVAKTSGLASDKIDQHEYLIPSLGRAFEKQTKQLKIKLKKTSLKFKSLKPNFQQQLAMKGAIPEDQLNKAAKMNLRELTKQKKFEEAREDLIYETRKCFIICT